MPITDTPHMLELVEDLYKEGWYAKAASVAALVVERDALRALLAQAPSAPAVFARHLDALSPNVPEGFETVLGYLARNRPDLLDLGDWRDPGVTALDGYWLTHRSQAQSCWVTAPPALEARGIRNVRAYPVALLAQRFWGSSSGQKPR